MSSEEAELPIESVLEALPEDAARIETVLDVLSRERRRRVLAVLIDRDGVMDLGELARAVVARRETDSEAGSSELDEQRVRIELHHCHLPKLADAGLLEYDYETKEVRFSRALDVDCPPIESNVLESLVSSGD